VEPTRRGLPSAEGLCTRPAQVPQGCILHRGDRDRGEVTRAPQAGQCEGVPPGSWDPRPGLFGAQGGRDAPADMACLGARAGEPRATRPRCRDKDELGACGLQPAAKGIDSALARTEGPKGDAGGVRCLGDVSDGHGLFMHISPDVECARLVHG
jgi:hypothetical protein